MDWESVFKRANKIIGIGLRIGASILILIGSFNFIIKGLSVAILWMAYLVDNYD